MHYWVFTFPNKEAKLPHHIYEVLRKKLSTLHLDCQKVMQLWKYLKFYASNVFEITDLGYIIPYTTQPRYNFLY